MQPVGCRPLTSSTYWVKTVGRQGRPGTRKGQLVADLLTAEIRVGTSSLDLRVEDFDAGADVVTNEAYAAVHAFDSTL